MKTLFQKLTVLLFGVLLSFSVSLAQDGTDLVTDEPVDENLPKNLTEQQRNMLQEQKMVNARHREAFSATLSPEQEAILDNPELTREQKRETLRATLTTEQKTMLQEQQTLRVQQRDMFRATLTEEQQVAMRKMARKSGSESAKRIRQSGNEKAAGKK
ncbi:MAG: hypothetical protein JXJ22_14405 [Bacteroidales bacterium]|nr:hypothetical protein [Bacteroidales bacterium]